MKASTTIILLDIIQPGGLTIDTEVEVLEQIAGGVADATLVASGVPQTGTPDPQQLTSVGDLHVRIP